MRPGTATIPARHTTDLAEPMGGIRAGLKDHRCRLRKFPDEHRQNADSPDPFPSPTLQASWKGGGSLAAAVAGGKSELHRARGRVTPVRPEIHAGGHDVRRGRQTVPQRKYRPRRKVRVRVKRRFKRPPLATQEAGHGKPPREQDQIGNLRCGPHRIGASRSGSGYRSLREMTLSLAQVRKTEFGLQPFQDTDFPPNGGGPARDQPSVPAGITATLGSGARSQRPHPAPPWPGLHSPSAPVSHGHRPQSPTTPA